MTREQSLVDAIEVDIALSDPPATGHRKVTDRIKDFESTNVTNVIQPIKDDIAFQDHSIPLCTSGQTTGTCRTPINQKVTDNESKVSTIATDIGMTFDPVSHHLY